MPIVEVPGMGDVEFPDDMNDDQIAAAIKSNLKRDTTAEFRVAREKDPTPPELFNTRDSLKSTALNAAKFGARELGLTGRTILNAATSIPLAAMDAGVGIRNFIDEKMRPKQLRDLIAPQQQPGYELPSQTWNKALNDYGVPQHEGLEKVGDVVGQMAFGGMLPAPGIKAPAPANFNMQGVRDMTLQASQKAGYTVPPATAKPSIMNKVLEGAAGKLSTAQTASARNQAVTQELAKKAVGITGEITPAALDEVASNAFQSGYAPIRNIGTMRADAKYADDLTKIASKFKGASKSFPEAAKTDITDIVSSMQKKSFESDSAVDMISILRERAKTAYRQGDGDLGGAYRSISKALESAIERGLARRGKDGTELLKNFRDARQLIAKTHSVGDALNESTGVISATKLAQQLGRGKPLSGDLKTVAQFGQAFPKAAREFNESLPGISPLDFYSSGGIAAATKNPWYLGGPFVRPAVRSLLLSPQGQRMLTSQPGQLPPELLMGGATGLLGQ